MGRNYPGWEGFKKATWANEINVRSFIRHNYTPYDGDDSFLAGPTQDTLDLWDQVMDLTKQEREAGGVLDMDTKVISTITSHGPGYLNKDKERIVGFQTDKPFKRALMPYGGIRMAEKACADNGYTVDPQISEFFSVHRKTHNAGVFDAYTPEMRACRSSHIITGLPDAYGRGRIIGDYRRVALYGVDRLIEDKEEQKRTTRSAMYSDVIRDREELSEQIRALQQLKEMAASYGFDISTLTTTAATVSWNASFDTDSFEVALSENYIPDTVEVDPEQLVWHGFLVDDEFAFSTAKQGIELTRNKTYYVYVRAYCQGAVSEWNGVSFRTKNIINLPLTETFTNGKGWDYKTGTLNHIDYWTFGTSIKREDGITMEYMPFVNTNTEPGTATAGYYAFDKNFCLAFTGARALGTAVPAGAYVYAATPELNVEKIQNVFVSFWGTAYQKVGDIYAGGIIVGVMTDPEDFTTFVPVDTCYITETSTFSSAAFEPSLFTRPAA